MADFIERAKGILEKKKDYDERNSGLAARSEKKFSDEKAKILATDFVADYSGTYQASLESLEEIFANWDSVQKRTKGLSFRIGDYIKKVKPRAVTKGGVFQYFDNLVAEGRNAIVAVSRSKSIEDDVEPQKRFCQCLVDLRYVVDNSKRLLEETGVQSGEQSKRLADVEKRLKADRESIASIVKERENEIASEAEKLRKDIENAYKKIEGSLIGAPIEEKDPDYKFLIGFAKRDPRTLPDKNTIKEIDKLIGAPEMWNSTTPVYYNPRHSNGVIIIKAGKRFFDPSDGSKDAVKLIRNIYLSMAASLPAKNLQIGGIESTTEAVVASVANSVSRYVSTTAVYGQGVFKKDRIRDFQAGLLSKINERSGKCDETKPNIFDYNEKTPDSTEPLIMAVYNNIPTVLGDNPKSATEDFYEILEKGALRGILPIVCVNTGAEENYLPPLGVKNDNDPYIRADVIEIDSDRNATYNGVPVSLDITTRDFDVERYYNILKEREKNSSTITLEKVIAQSENIFGRENERVKRGLLRASEANIVTPFSSNLRVPIGVSDGKLFCYDIKPCSNIAFGIITGVMGSGKSSFLHTFILSMCYFYPPDELSLYLVDFKSEEDSPEFSNYRNDGTENLYVPQIKYLSLKSKRESAFDLINKIKSLHNERSKLLSRMHKGSMQAYNELPEVKSGKMPKMPFAIFIIDEYNKMFDTSPEAAMANESLSGKFKELVSTVRASGIGIYLSGQYLDPNLKSDMVNQMASRISLSMGNADALGKMFDFTQDFEKKNEYAIELLNKGKALFSTTTGLDKTLVQFAFAGGTGSAQQLRIAQKIREKYKNNPGSDFIQAEAGGEGMFPVIDGLGCPDIEEETSAVFSIPVGVSSSSMTKNCMRFSVEDENSGNYASTASREKLLMLERVSAAMFRKATGGDIVYISDLNMTEAFYSGYGSKKDLMRRIIKSVSGDENKAKEISDLYKEFTRREKLFKESRGGDIKPMYIILHGAEWLFEKGMVAIDSGSPAASSSSVSGGGDFDMSEFGIDSDVAALVSSYDPSAASKEMVSISDIKEYVGKLHRMGNRYKMFMLISSEAFKPFKSLIYDENGKLAETTVYGSYEEIGGDRITGEKNNGCMYILPDGAKTRIFDINSEKYPSFWKDIK